MKVNNVPAVSKDGRFTIYGVTNAYTTVTATAIYESAGTQNGSLIRTMLIRDAVAESNGVRKTVGNAVSDAKGAFAMDIQLPMTGPLTFEVSSGTAYARYAMTYDTSAGAAATAAPGASASPAPNATVQPSAAPEVVEEKNNNIIPIVLVVLALLCAAGAYGYYIWRKRSEEELDNEEDEDDRGEKALREQQLQRTRQQNAAVPGSALRRPYVSSGDVVGNTSGNGPKEVPDYMKKRMDKDGKPDTAAETARPEPVKTGNPYQRQGDNPYARKEPGQAPVKPVAPVPPTPPVPPKASPAPAESVKPASGSTANTANPADNAPRRRRRSSDE